MTSNEELMLYTLKYPQLEQLSKEHAIEIINDYKKWLWEDLDWLLKRGENIDTMNLLNVYLEYLRYEEEEEDYEVPGQR